MKAWSTFLYLCAPYVYMFTTDTANHIITRFLSHMQCLDYVDINTILTYRTPFYSVS